MKKIALALLLALTLVPLVAEAQELPDGSGNWITVDREEPLALWLHSILPNTPHVAMTKRVGTWDVNYRSWYQPGKPPIEAQGTAEREMIHERRVLQETINLPLPGRHYTGISQLGYNNVTDEYWWQRMDNMSTWMTRSTSSEYGEDGAISFVIPVFDISDASEAIAKVVLRTEPDREVHEWYQADVSGNVFKSIEFVYTRTATEDEAAGEDAEAQSVSSDAASEDDAN